MSGVRFNAQTAPIATGTALKTLLQLIAAANHRVKVEEISLSFSGIDNTGLPILVQIIRQTDAGTMSALTPEKIISGDDDTLQTTAQHTATVEPSLGAEIFGEYIHPQGGFTWQAPFGKELILEGGERLAIVVTAGASVNAKARMVCEE